MYNRTISSVNWNTATACASCNSHMRVSVRPVTIAALNFGRTGQIRLQPRRRTHPFFQDLPASAYRGRFAPSPTGLLHAGSLTTAVGSYRTHASQGGQWLLRTEDLDPTPRGAWCRRRHSAHAGSPRVLPGMAP